MVKTSIYIWIYQGYVFLRENGVFTFWIIGKMLPQVPTKDIWNQRRTTETGTAFEGKLSTLCRTWTFGYTFYRSNQLYNCRTRSYLTKKWRWLVKSLNSRLHYQEETFCQLQPDGNLEIPYFWGLHSIPFCKEAGEKRTIQEGHSNVSVSENQVDESF